MSIPSSITISKIYHNRKDKSIARKKICIIEGTWGKNPKKPIERHCQNREQSHQYGGDFVQQFKSHLRLKRNLVIHELMSLYIGGRWIKKSFYLLGIYAYKDSIVSY